jgi:hypothetical protein
VISHAWKALGTERYWFRLLLLPLKKIFYFKKYVKSFTIFVTHKRTEIMREKLKQHTVIFLVVVLLIHLGTAYMEGTLNPMHFSKGTRESQLMILIYTQVLAHFCWLNREKIIKELKK